ncbi:MAG: beta strand repeat-containing protein [Rubrivivax sp.]
MPSLRTPLQRLALAAPWRLAVAGLLLAALLLMRPTLSANLTVGTTTDTVDGDTSSVSTLVANPGADGKVSLREAITAANNTAGSDTITLPAATYTLANGQLEVTDTLAIVGSGPTSTVVDGDNSNRVLTVANVALTLQELTLTRGSASSRGAALQKGTANLTALNVVFSANNSQNEGGGAVYSGGGTDTFTGCSFSNNNASGGGGALLKVAGTLNISGSSFANNRSSNTRGGAIDFTGSSLSLANTSFSGNSTSGTNGGAVLANVSGSASVTGSQFTNNVANNSNGGGLYTDGAASWAISDTEFDNNRAGTAGAGLYVASTAAVGLTRVTFVDNVATNGQGGGLRVAHGNASTTTATNVTFHSNDAPSSGGGGAAVSSGTLALVNTTVVNNTAVNGAAALTNGGGTLTLKNTLVAANTGGTAQCSGTLTSQGNNLDSANSCGFTATGDRVNATAGLGSFANHGGNTRTVALTSTSAAINNGTSTGAPTTDQRGYGRVGNPDIGAYEFNGTSGAGISGTVFEDRHYGGGAGRSLADAAGVGLAGARVELYSAAGSYLQATTTDGDGRYSFSGLTANTSYAVRVPTATLPSGRNGGSSSLPGVLTFRASGSTGTAVAVTNFVGGTNPRAGDPGPGSAGTVFTLSTGVFSTGLSGTAQAYSPVTVGSGTVSGIDFGLNFSTVSNNNSAGQGSLTQALLNANAHGGDGDLAVAGRTAGIEHLIFMVPNGTNAPGLRSSISDVNSAGVVRITLENSLPEITAPLVVNAQTQPGWVSTPVVLLNGNNVNYGLRATNTSQVTLRGFAVGTVAFNAVLLTNCSQCTVAGNHLGVDAAGTATLPVGVDAIELNNSTGCTIGGTAAADRNVISGAVYDGVFLNGSSTGNTVLGNHIGSDVTGNVALGNGDNGIDVRASASGNFIGTAAAGNVVVASGNQGLYIASSGNTLQGNKVGLAADGLTPLRNGGDGLDIDGGDNNLVGGTTAAQRNVFSNATASAIFDGIYLRNGANNNTVTGNYIGTDISGTVPRGNAAAGVRITGGSSNNTIGGTASGAANLIAFNDVGVDVDSGQNNRVRGNSIQHNTTAGIRLGLVLPNNDGVLTSGGPNLYMDHPVVTNGSLSGSTLTLSGYVGSAGGQAAMANSTVDVYLSDTANPGRGQGRTWLGSFTTDATTGSFSNKTVTCSSCPAEAVITLTATDPNGNTSTFGNNLVVDRGHMVSGVVFEDINYGGGAGRNRQTALREGGALRPNARLELYQVSGSNATMIATTTTDSVGSYAFSGLADGSYYLRVVSSTVTSSRSGAGASLIAVTTFMRNASSSAGTSDVTNHVGGADPDNTGGYNTTVSVGGVTTTAALTATGDGIAAVTKSGGSTLASVDFGYSYNVVSNNNPSGQGSLRQAILNANALGNDARLQQNGRSMAMEHLVFMLSYGTNTAGLRNSNNYFSGGVATITPTAALPTVSAPLVIDARTQPNWTANPVLQLAGQSAGSTSSGFTVTGGGSTVAGFIINRFAYYGVYLNGGSGNTVAGNWIGLSSAGTAASANAAEGVLVYQSAGNTIGGLASRDRNVISGNGTAGGSVGGNNGIVLTGGSCSGNQILGNHIGTNVAGTAAVKNQSLGMYVECPNTVVGGSTSTARNVISGNEDEAIYIDTLGAGTVVQGNYIGTNAAGTAAMANADRGIYVAAPNVVIGGSASGQGNLISGNLLQGVVLDTANATGAVLMGNLIGRNAANSANLPNGSHGVLVMATAANHTIGGTGAGEANTIRGNGGDGVQVLDAGATGVRVRGNTLAGNTGAGIKLALSSGTVGVANGSKSTAEPNLGMDSATLTSAVFDSNNNSLTVAGYVGSAAGQSTFAGATVDLYIADTTAAGNGEGQTWLGSFTTDASGNFSGTLTVASGITGGTTRLTATATDSANNTSEFGPNRVVTTPAYPMGGTVFEDRHYGGGAGRSLASSGGSGVAGARVELYDSAGAFVASTTTASDGSYTLPSQTAGTWYVRVVGSTVASNRSGVVPGLLPVLTFRSHASAGTVTAVTDQVGGLNPALGQDAPSAAAGASFNPSTGVFSAGVSGTAQQFSAVQVGTAAVTGIDFGFSFNTVSNTNDSGAGSLRQAILNANALGGDNTLAQAGRTAGVEHLVFMLSNGTAAAGLRSTNNVFSGGVATITPTSALPEISTPMTVDAQAQPGWSAAPIVELNGASAGANVGGITARGGVTLRGLVINRFNGNGVNLLDAGSHTVAGCYIGTNAAGTAASANGGEGILLYNSPNNTLGGTATSQGNVVSGNGINGITIVGSSGGTQVLGNTVGLNAAGTARIANGSLGLYINAPNTVVGGTSPTARNVVAGNTYENLQLGPSATGSSVLGNLFGTNASGAVGPVNGGDNVYVNGASSVTLSNNTVAAANGVGVLVVGNVTGVAVLGNRIFGNSALGIDLGYNGINTNDGVKTAGQPNTLMDTPVFTSASMSGSTLTVTGYVGSAAGQATFANARVEIFISDSSGTHGQGRTYLGFLTTDASGNFSGSLANVSGVANASTALTATATDTSNNTSEFGPNVAVGLVLAGTVFEDRHYGGGAGRSLATSGGTGLAGATVELYNGSGAYVRSTTTAAGGGYSFGALASGNYHLRVVNSSVRSARTGSTPNLLPVMTWRATAASGAVVAVTDHVGGTNPAVADPGAASSGAAFNTSSFVFSAGPSGTAQSVAPVLLNSSLSGLDFGFNFHTVVNTLNAGQGSLRQAIANTDALTDDSAQAVVGQTAGRDVVVFMVANGSAAAGLRSSLNYTSGGVATITPASRLDVAGTLVLAGHTQPGWSVAQPVVELNGSNLTLSTNQHVLRLSGPGSTLRSFIINRGGVGAVQLSGGTATLHGNWLGTSSTGLVAQGNHTGVEISSAGNTVGGTAAAERNVISGNTYGLLLREAVAQNNVIAGNYIGLAADGSTALGNSNSGVYVTAGASNNRVGGTVAGEGNVIAHNGRGVLNFLDSSTVVTTGLRLQRNSLHSNTTQGIELAFNGTDGINTNDGAKNNNQPNLGMDHPVFTSAALVSGNLVVAGYVGSAAGQATFAGAVVEIFLSDNSQTHGQGRTWLGSLTADASGNFSGTLSGVAGVANGSSRLTATATDAAGNTSEFGPNVSVGLGLSGTVFEDRHYGGGAGRSLAASGGTGAVGATVELYNASGVQVASTTTATGGAYAFRGLAEGVYSVRVVDSTVRSNRTGSSSALRAVLTFRTDATAGTVTAVTDHVGGFHPAVADGAAVANGAGLWTFCANENTTCGFSGTQLLRYGADARFSHRVVTASGAPGGISCSNAVFGDPAPNAGKNCYVYNQAVQSLATVNLGSADVQGLDFGYSFHAVVNTQNSGQGSLRQAITNANTLGDDGNQAQAGRSAGIDHLVFMLPNGSAAAGLRAHVPTAFTTNGGSANVASIVLSTGLPSVSTAMVIDAQTQPGFGTRPLLEINGAAAGNTTGFTLAAAGTVLRGFIVNRFIYSGIEVTASATVQGNWSGVNATGLAAAGNQSHGLNLTGGTATVGGTAATQGNVVSGNAGAGVWISGGSAHVLQGNLVGLGADGSTRVGNTGFYGIEAHGAGGYTIGGSAAGAGNTISGQTGNGKGGLWLCSPNNNVTGNRIGTNLAGTAAVPNNATGVVVCSGQVGNLLGSAAAGNVVSGNAGPGIYDAGTGTVLQGNRIGVNASGDAALANNGHGVVLVGAGTVVGGLLAGEGNQVSGNAQSGVVLDGGSGGHRLQGNLIGLNAAGTAALGNGGQGVHLLNGSTGNVVGGATPAARNVVSGNTLNGVWLTSRGNVVQGNRIGTNAAGTAALPNGEDGVQINTVTGPNTSPAATVGGSNAGEGNLLSGNTGSGLRVYSGDVRVWGNTIGLDAGGTSAVANQYAGIRVRGGSSITIGGTDSGQANTVSGNNGNGVEVDADTGETAQGVRISGNRIWGNSLLGIDLMSPYNTRAVSANDGALVSTQPNRGMDQPVFTSARARGSLLTVAGHVGSAAGQTAFAGAVVEVFVHDSDASGQGEGQRYLGQVTADANGNFSGSFTMPVSGLAIGAGLSGTATSPSGDTSEFGPQFNQLQVDLVVNSTTDAADSNPGDGLCNTAGGVCTLRAALQELNAWTSLPQTPTVAFDLPGCSAAGQAACSIAPSTALPTVARALAIDGSSQPGWSGSTGQPLVELNGATAPANTIGLVVNTSGFTLRGLVVNRWGSHGVSLGGSGHTVAGNWFGVNAAGTAAAGNGGHGLHLTGSSSLVGGTGVTERNVFSGNSLSGLALLGAGHTVLGNTAGLLPDGSTAAGNTQDGVYVSAANQRIGGAAAGEGNVLSHNGRSGLRFDTGSDGSTAHGNLIGTARDGSTARGNGHLQTNGGSGIGVVGTASDLALGGTTAGQGNTLAYNTGAGVGFGSTSARRVAIQGNRMFDNGNLGIRLQSTNQVLANNGSVGSGVANQGMDHPVITGAGVNSNGSALTVYGFIGTGSGQAVFAGARVEVFRAAADPSGYGEGQVYLGALTADASGRFSGTLAFTAGTLAVGDRVTATATAPAGDTSEFGPNWTTTTVEALAPAGFNAFDPGTAAGAVSGPIVSQTAGAATTLAVVALDSSGSGLHPSFSGNVQLFWLDARNNSGTATGSCRSSWVNLGSAGTASFSSSARVNVALTVPSTGTRDMRLQMVYAGPAGTVTACSGDNFAALPASLVLLATDQDAATAGTARTLGNTSVNGGVVHRAGQPFTLAVRALASGGTLMANYDGTPSVATTACLLPSGCTAGTLTGSLAAASAGVASAAYAYSEVGAVQLQATDAGFGAVDAADTPLAARTVVSAATAVGRFVPDRFSLALSTPGVLATGNASCLASGSAATFFDQGFGWATPPQATLTAQNAQGATTTGWTGALMKLDAGTGATPTLAVANAGTTTLASSFGAVALTDLGNGQVRLQANATDRFLLALASGALQASLNPSFTWTLAVADASEAAVAGNPASTAASLSQVGLGFDQGGAFHQGRLSLSSSHGDARRGVRALVQLQRYTADGWVTMTEDRGCVSIAPGNLGVAQPSGVFSTAGVCAAPLASTVTTRGGRAWLALPASPGGRTGRLQLRRAGQAATGQACVGVGNPQTVVPLGLPHLTGGDTGQGPAALATWGAAQRDTVLRRETW